jgi:hypothetical protein
MLNHARNLLLNVNGSSQATQGCPGEELIDPAYKAVPLPTYLQQVRSVIFGQAPDRCFLNYRAAQLLQMLQATELLSSITALDPRLTYPSVTDLLPDSSFAFQQQTLSGTDVLSPQGSAAVPDITGKCFHDFLVATDGAEIVVTEYSPTPQEQIYPANYTDDLSVPVPLGNSGYSASVPASGGTWRAWCFNRPQWDLGQLVPVLSQIGEANLLSLFGVKPTGVYQLFNTLWLDHPYLPYKLGGLVLAVIYRTEAIRTGVISG